MAMVIKSDTTIDENISFTKPTLLAWEVDYGPLIDINVEILNDDSNDQYKRASNKRGMEPNMSIRFTFEIYETFKDMSFIRFYAYI